MTEVLPNQHIQRDESLTNLNTLKRVSVRQLQIAHTPVIQVAVAAATAVNFGDASAGRVQTVATTGSGVIATIATSAVKPSALVFLTVDNNLGNPNPLPSQVGNLYYVLTASGFQILSTAAEPNTVTVSWMMIV